MATPVDELDVPFVSLAPTRSTPQRTRHELAESEHWLFRTELGYLVVAYHDLLVLLRDGRWHSGISRLAGPVDPAFDEWRAERQPSLLQTDGADHQRIRHAIAPSLTPRGADALRPFMRETVHELLDPVLERGRAEFVGAVCDPYPTRVIFELLGVPRLFEERFAGVIAPFALTNLDPAVDPETVMAATSAIDGFATELAAYGRSREAITAGSGGLLAVLIEARERGELSEPELIALIDSVLLAGTESTRCQLANAAFLFARFPDQFQLLRRRPELVELAVEESMRYLGTVRGTARVASEDIDYRDVRFPAGTLVMAGFSAANRDPALSDQPNVFDITNDPGRSHLTLGHGLHFCIGAALARAELQEALLALAARTRRIELDGAVEWRPPSADFWGPAALPLHFD